MANQISGIRNRVTLLCSATTVAATLFLLLVSPVVTDLAPQDARYARLTLCAFGFLFLIGVILALRSYLRPISDLGYALEIGSTPVAELAENARRIAFNAPIYFFVIPTCTVFTTSLLSNLLGSLLWPDYGFAGHLSSTLLSTVIAAGGSLVVALICRQWMRPVLLYTAARLQAGGHRLNIRARLFAAIITVVLLALIFPGAFGYTQVVKAYRDQTADTALLYLESALDVMPSDLTPEKALEYVSEQLDASVEYDHLFLTDDSGEVLDQQSIETTRLTFDSQLWRRTRPGKFRSTNRYFVLVPVDLTGRRLWVGLGYVFQPLRSREAVRTVVALSASGAVALALAALISHYLATDVIVDLRDVTSRLLDIAHEERVDLGSPVPVLSLDEVGDLILAHNALQQRVRIQQEQIEFKQRQLIALQSLSYKIGTIRDVDHLMQEVIRDVERAFGYHNVSILLTDEDEGELYFAATGLLEASVRNRRFRIGQDGVVGRVAATGVPLLINDVSTCDFYIADRTNTRAELAVPMPLGDRVIGVFNVSSERTGAFEDGDLRIVTALSNQVAIAIENARLFSEVTANANELERRARNLMIVHNVSVALSVSLRLEDVLKTVTEQLVSLFEIGHCAVILFDEEDGYGQVAAEHPDRGVAGQQIYLKSFPVVRWMRTARQPLFIPDPQHSEQLEPLREFLVSLDVQSTLLIPLMTKGTVEGIVALNATDDQRVFTPAEIDICQTISAQVAVSLENVQLIESLRMQADMLARMARDVAAERSQLNAILRNLVDVLLVTDIEGHIILFNPAFLFSFNLSEQGLKGQLITEIVPELPLQNLLTQTKQAQTAHLQEMTLPDGRFFQITAAGVRNRDQLNAVVMVLRDVTRERQLDEMKSDFISTVSHEFRTPLTPVIGFAKLIQKAFNRNILPALPADEKRAQRAASRVVKNLDILISEVERLSALVDDVLFLADLDAGRLKWRMEKISLVKMLENSVDIHRQEAAGKGIALRTEWAADLPLIYGDVKRMSRAIKNMVSNALKFTDQGEVVIRAQRIERGDDNWETLPSVNVPEQLSAGSYILVTVTDTGSGISPEAQQALFERFGQGMRDMLTDKPSGTGLGLALSKEIISHHSGRIWVESARGQGSTFAFVLPLPAESSEPPLWEGATSVLDSAPTILVVDDEPAVRELMYYILMRAGYRTLMAVDGPTALNMARIHMPDLIVLDIMIPGISGLDVTSVLKADESTKNIPIVILSIMADPEKAAQLGADACFAKPIEQDAFLEKLAELLAMRRKAAQKG